MTSARSLALVRNPNGSQMLFAHPVPEPVFVYRFALVIVLMGRRIPRREAQSLS